jgi:hypothetical protein
VNLFQKEWENTESAPIAKIVIFEIATFII